VNLKITLKKLNTLKDSGIYQFHITHDEKVEMLLGDNPLIILQQFDNDSQPVVLLKEHKYFIRPQGYYVGRLDSMTHSRDSQTALVTSYGKPVSDDLKMTVNSMLNPEIVNALLTIPPNGVVGAFKGLTTGVATFEFIKAADIPNVRLYGQPMCPGDDRLTIPIDGQVYFFYYGIEGVEDEEFKNIQTAYLAHSDVRFRYPYTWVKDVGPILTQYARITPMMKTILDMSDYSDVTKPHNINLLKKNLNLPFGDPGYMPTTQNLSPVKRAMILEWLGNPIYDQHCTLPLILADEEKKAVPRKEGKPSMIPLATPPSLQIQMVL
jgi:hypothetical protein